MNILTLLKFYSHEAIERAISSAIAKRFTAATYQGLATDLGITLNAARTMDRDGLAQAIASVFCAVR